MYGSRRTFGLSRSVIEHLSRLPSIFPVHQVNREGRRNRLRLKLFGACTAFVFCLFSPVYAHRVDREGRRNRLRLRLFGACKPVRSSAFVFVCLSPIYLRSPGEPGIGQRLLQGKVPYLT
jgi:hypothetical protein